MLLIPAITLKDGKCEGGNFTPGSKSVSDDILQVAATWVRHGAQRLHVTDMDAGIAGKNAGFEALRALAEAHPDIPIQVAGNLRNGNEVERYMGAGAEYVILDTRAAGAPHFVNDLCLEYPGHILMVLEAKGGKPAAGGWSKLARHPIEETARHFQQAGVAGILYRAVADARGDCDIAPAVALAEILTIPVLVSAGLKSFETVRNLCQAAEGLAGAVLDPEYRGTAPDFANIVPLPGHSPGAE